MSRPRPAQRIVIIGPPPTPNGDLHVGHIAGPYMGADVHARYARAAGRSVVYATGTDDSQTYVAASAAKQAVPAQVLAERSWHAIEQTLHGAGISVDGFAPFDEGYRATVLDFLTRLHTAGKFELRTVELPWNPRTQTFLVEGLVQGGCPVCLATSRGGLCESCGHPNNFSDLSEPRSTIHPEDRLTTATAQILVLPLEAYREQLSAYHQARQGRWRPHLVQLMGELLARPLPDFPITYPLDWGIAAPFAETPGQVLNAWAEGMPASMYCTFVAQQQLGEHPFSTDALWRSQPDASQDVQLAYFLGFDNAYFWAVSHLALLMAHEGRYVLPDMVVGNEFYELDNDKFSTSKGHVVWARDLMRDVPRDLVRFYLALSAPEHSRTNFSFAAARTIANNRVALPWNALAGLLNKALAELGSPDALAVSPAAQARCQAMAERFAACYELETFSLSRAADLITLHLQRLLEGASQPPVTSEGGPERRRHQRQDEHERLGDLFAETGALLSAAAPILIDLAEQAREGGAVLDAFASSGPARESGLTFAVPYLALWPVGSAASCTSA